MMFCTNCGKKIEEGNAFCTNCGKSVNGAGNGVASPAINTANNPKVSTVSMPASNAAKVITAAERAGESPQKPGKQKIILVGIIVGIVVIVLAVAAVGLVVSGAIDSLPFFQTTKQETIVVDSSSSSSSSSSTNETNSTNATNSSSSSSVSESNSSSASSSSSEYMLPDVATRLYTEAELSELSDWELYIARNEIFARHGRGFSNADLVQYFSDQPWYTQLYSPQEFDAMPTPLNDIERANSDLIRSIEAARGSQYAV